MNRDRQIIVRRLQEAAEQDPVSAARAIEQMASSSPPALTFASAIADFLCSTQATALSAAFRDSLLDHLVSLGPSTFGQLSRVALTALSAPTVLAALERESVALDVDDDRFTARLRLAIEGPSSEEIFGQIAQSSMARGHRWPHVEWEEWTTRTASMRHAATRVVWAHSPANPFTFRRTPEGELLDHRDAPVELPADAVVFVPHPSDFTSGELDLWSRVFAEYDIVSAFPQFSRTTAHLPDSWANRDAVPLHRGIDRDRAIRQFVRSDWSIRRKGTRSYFDRSLRGPTVATISWHASGDVAHLIELYFASPTGAPVYLGNVDPVAYSEALLTLSKVG